MKRLIKILNKYNGNVCFVGVTETQNIIFECDRESRVLSYDFASKPIFGVCLKDKVSYYVALNDNWIGLFSGGILNETYINTGLSNVDELIINTSGDIYILERDSNQLHKYNAGIVWSISLPDYSLRYGGHITLRESDGMIIYQNGSTIYLVRDDITSAIVFNSVDILGYGDISIVVSNEFNPTYAYMRVRSVSGAELDQSSSSSSSS